MDDSARYRDLVPVFRRYIKRIDALLLNGISKRDFNRARGRAIKHDAGFDKFERSAPKILALYGLPNFFFHLASVYATLRQSGVNIGKGDFDGLHFYPAGFNFDTAG